MRIGPEVRAGWAPHFYGVCCRSRSSVVVIHPGSHVGATWLLPRTRTERTGAPARIGSRFWAECGGRGAEWLVDGSLVAVVLGDVVGESNTPG
jgi:hypothetical protein